MFSDTECGICYLTYNVARRCPRQLSCKHTFCESCLVTLARSAQSTDPRLFCPLCRHCTALSDDRIKENLPVDEDVLDRIVTAGNFEGSADEEEDEGGAEPNHNASNQSKEDSPPRSPKGRFMRSIRRLCKKIKGESRRNCMTDEDLKDLALMSCYMM